MKPFQTASVILRNAFLIGKASTLSIGTHWGLALFSLATAFVIWFTVQDVENPRAEGRVPIESEQAIPVTALNVPQGYIVSPLDSDTVRVNVRAREDDLLTLRAADFRATVDVQQMGPGILFANLPVTVESRRDNVQVTSVFPPAVPVNLVEAKDRVFNVAVKTAGTLPEGYREVEDRRVIEPREVTITGLPELVDSVVEVVIIVPLNGLRDEASVVEGELVARNANANPVSVTLSETRARVTLRIEQTIVRRTMELTPNVTGLQAPGYRVSNIRMDPPRVGVSGPEDIMNNLTEIRPQPLDITGAKNTINNIERAIDKPPGVTLDRQSVSITVEIEPIDCTNATGGPGCLTLIYVNVTPEEIPTGLTVAPTVLRAVARVNIPPTMPVDASMFRATVSLAGGVSGLATYTPKVTGPTGVTIDSVDPIQIRLIPAATP